MTAGAAAYPPALGGTGTGVPPTSGQVLIGNGAGTYTPALITPGTDIIITNASGSVTIAVRNSDFLPSSTIYVASVNGQTGAVTITSSTLGVATNTLSLFNGNGFTTTTIQSVLNALSATGLASYNSSTGQFSVSSSSLNLKSASQYNYSDFLPSSTVYVATVNGQSGAVTIGVPATTTINGVQSTVFKIIGDGTTVTSTVNGTTTTFSIINTGNWQGPWQGVNSTTFYLASNPLGFVTSSIINGLLSTSTASNTYYLLTNPAGYLTAASSGLLYYPLNSNPAGYVTSTVGSSATGTSTYVSVFSGTSTLLGYAPFTYNSSTNVVTISNELDIGASPQKLTQDPTSGLRYQDNAGDGNGKQSIFTIHAPSSNPQESDLSIVRSGSVNTNASGSIWWDFSNECYGSAGYTQLNCTVGPSAFGTFDEIQGVNGSSTFVPFRIGWWNQNLGGEATNTRLEVQYNPSSSVAFGPLNDGSSTDATYAMTILSTSTYNTSGILALATSTGGAYVFTVDNSGNVSSTGFINTAASYQIGGGTKLTTNFASGVHKRLFGVQPE
jgi:hypothetical protein